MISIRTAGEIASETGADVLAIECDVSKTADIKKVVDETVKKYKRIDILVNNAGGPPTGTFLDFSLDDWQKAIELNLFSTITFSREALPFMKEQRWGRIINITSVAVKQPIDGLILSNTARAGVIGLAKTLSNEFGPYNITVNNVCPGRILTDRITHLAGEKAKREGTSVEDALSRDGDRPTPEADRKARRAREPRGVFSLGEGRLHYGHDDTGGRRADEGYFLGREWSIQDLRYCARNDKLITLTLSLSPQGRAKIFMWACHPADSVNLVGKTKVKNRDCLRKFCNVGNDKIKTRLPRLPSLA